MQLKSINSSGVAPLWFAFIIQGPAQTSRQHVAEEAVLLPGKPGEWDDANAALPVVIKEGDTLRMWYNGFTDGSYYGGPGYGGYAWSLDGTKWHKHDKNPIKIAIQSVIKDGERYQAWEPGRMGAKFYESSDGIHWEIWPDTTYGVGNIHKITNRLARYQYLNDWMTDHNIQYRDQEWFARGTGKTYV